MVSWWTSWGYQTVISGIKNKTSSIWWGASEGAGGVQFCKKLKDIILCIPWGGTRTRPQSCTVVSSLPLLCLWASQVALVVKIPPANTGNTVQSLGHKDPLEEGTATHSSIPTWRIPMDRGAWQAIVHGVARVEHNWSDWARMHKPFSLHLPFPD